MAPRADLQGLPLRNPSTPRLSLEGESRQHALAGKTRRNVMTRITAAAGLVALAMSGAAVAQNFPTKPIQLISMHTGVADGYTRLMVGKMGESMGQPLIVDQRLGAGGAIAAEAVARAAPDGYTLLAAFPDAMINRHTLVKNVPYDTVRDFTPITQLADPNIILAVAPGVANDLKDYLAKAKAQPGKLGYGSLGIGSS